MIVMHICADLMLENNRGMDDPFSFPSYRFEDEMDDIKTRCFPLFLFSLFSSLPSSLLSMIMTF